MVLDLTPGVRPGRPTSPGLGLSRRMPHNYRRRLGGPYLLQHALHPLEPLIKCGDEPGIALPYQAPTRRGRLLREAAVHQEDEGFRITVERDGSLDGPRRFHAGRLAFDKDITDARVCSGQREAIADGRRELAAWPKVL